MLYYIEYCNLIMAAGQQCIAHRFNVYHIRFIIYIEYIRQCICFYIVLKYFAIGVCRIERVWWWISCYFVESGSEGREGELGGVGVERWVVVGEVWVLLLNYALLLVHFISISLSISTYIYLIFYVWIILQILPIFMTYI